MEGGELPERVPPSPPVQLFNYEKTQNEASAPPTEHAMATSSTTAADSTASTTASLAPADVAALPLDGSEKAVGIPVRINSEGETD
jgi:hypothetical protein